MITKYSVNAYLASFIITMFGAFAALVLIRLANGAYISYATGAQAAPASDGVLHAGQLDSYVNTYLLPKNSGK